MTTTTMTSVSSLSSSSAKGRRRRRRTKTEDVFDGWWCWTTLSKRRRRRRALSPPTSRRRKGFWWCGVGEDDGSAKGGGERRPLKETRAWMTPKPTHIEETENNNKTSLFISSFLDERLASLFARRLARFMNEEEDEEETMTMKIDFKRDVADRCVRAVQKSNSEEEQRMFGLAVIESFVPHTAGRAFPPRGSSSPNAF